jgi:hypothetical protein
MSEDPEYLRDKGELATLKNAVACYFHQDMKFEFSGVDAAWEACALGHSSPSRTLLLSQIHRLIGRSDEEICRFWREWADWGLSSDSSAVRAYLLSGIQIIGAQTSSAD